MARRAVTREDGGVVPTDDTNEREVLMLVEEDLLMSLVAAIMDAVGESVVGIYLGGGLADTDFSPNQATVNLLVVTNSDPDRSMLTIAREVHLGIDEEYPDWGDRIDIEYVGLPGLAEFRQGQHIGLHSEAGETLHLEPLTELNVLGWESMRERSNALVGEPAEEVLPSFSREEFLRAVRAHASFWPSWTRQHTRVDQQVYAVLTMCRAWYSARQLRQADKREAALFTAAEFPQWEQLISWAEEWWYAIEEPTPHDQADAELLGRVGAFVDQLAEAVLMAGTPSAGEGIDAPGE